MDADDKINLDENNKIAKISFINNRGIKDK